ncbi:MFS transporter [Pseudooceanicola nanhaiensis]|uniref:MFS transporter n=1 Tax=Pseudooceanicola nanhaiensis TaxID=375761 RepID=UPI001CD2DA82|nr:MFS transporter [Pseudooceanicola nanhaiensis]MCA0920375.1 MFS transporter [Pseudooceanicola nanhaiensis]
MAPGAIRSLALLVCAEMAAMSLWFVSAAILPEMQAEASLTPGRAAALSSAVQLGFVLGALGFAIHGTPDRYDPRRVMAVAACLGALANAGLLITPVGGATQVALRGLTGVALAGVYPVGMKIAVGWSQRRRGLLVGILVCALTLGSAAPHALALAGGAEWRFTVMAASLLALLAAFLILFTRLGPHHATAPRFDPSALRLVWQRPRLRLAYAGYLCHMWELYGLWAWLAVALSVSFAPHLGEGAPAAARLLSFAAIALGGVLCIPAGAMADRWGKARVAGVCLAGSASAAFVTAAGFGGAPWVTVVSVLIWGALVIPDSALFSALVADAAPPDRAGSLMTFQTALGFLLTTFTVQGAPLVASALGWPATLALLGVGPVLGVEAMRRLARLTGERGVTY